MGGVAIGDKVTRELANNVAKAGVQEDKMNKTGEAGKKYLKTPDFSIEILGYKPATCPPVVDSLVGIESGDEHEEGMCQS